MSEKNPTIKDVARKAGVHFTTVSLAMRGHPSIPAATRERIRSIAAELGYVKNPVYAALCRFRAGAPATGTAKIAYLLNRSPESGLEHLWYHHEFVAGAREQAKSLGYELEVLYVAEDHHDSASLDGYLRAQGICGIVIGAFEPGYSDLVLNWDDYAVVKIDSLHMKPAATFVSNDQMQVVRLAYSRMRTLGYRRIGLAVGRTEEDGSGSRHRAGLLIEQSTVPSGECVPPLFFPYNSSRDTVCGLLGRWIRRHNVDAVLCSWIPTDDLVRDAGFRVPEEVACAGLCLPEDREAAVAGIVPHLPSVGAKAVSELATLLRAGVRGIPTFASSTYVQCLWRDGASAPARNR